MSIFIDTGAFIAFHNIRDKNHSNALKLIRKAASGEFGILYTSDYIFDESVTIALVRTNNPSLALRVGEMILGESKILPFIVMLGVSSEIFSESWRIFIKYVAKGLSFTDCTSITLIKSRGIENIMSFDSDFDGLVQRIS
jgi:hypothetical protein